MTTVILVIHILLALSLIGVVLLQRSEGGALGIGGGGAGGGLMSGRSAANLLTRTTAALATCFIITSLTLAILASGGTERSILESAPPPAQTEPAKPSAPIAPTSE